MTGKEKAGVNLQEVIVIASGSCVEAAWKSLGWQLMPRVVDQAPGASSGADTGTSSCVPGNNWLLWAVHNMAIAQFAFKCSFWLTVVRDSTPAVIL